MSGGRLRFERDDFADSRDFFSQKAFDTGPQGDRRHGAAFAGAEEADGYDAVVDADELDIASVELN